MEVTDGNDEALAAGIALVATMESFVCIHETSHVGTNMAHRVLNSSTQENGHPTKQKRAGPRGDIELIGLTGLHPTKLLLPLTEQLPQIVSVEATFPQ